MSLNTYLLLAIPVVGIFAVLAALHYLDPVMPKNRMKPGE